MSELLERLKERRIVRWAVAYVAGAWVVIEVVSLLGQLFEIPLSFQRGVVVVLAFGLPMTLILAWFHGEKGRQRVTGAELLLVTAVLGIMGAALTVLTDSDTPPGAGLSSVDAEAVDAGGTLDGSGARSSPSDQRSVAVLPFTDLSPAGDQAYFAEGVAEELRSVLSRVEGLRVASSTSSLSVEDRRLPPREIGERLGVTNLVEGSLRKSAQRLRIEARLVSVPDGFPVWSASFDADAADIFAVQDSIARAVARAFEIRVTGDAEILAPLGQTSDPVAQDLYLRGRFAWNRRTRAGLEAAVEHFSDAVERDSTYARALAGLADAYAVLGFYDYRPPAEAFPLAEEAARAALAIDSTMAEPHATLGYAALYHAWEWDVAESHFRTSIRLDPGYPVAHQWYANHLTAMGRFDEAVREMRVASELDPLSMIAYMAIGWVHFYAAEHQEALGHFASAAARDPSFELTYLFQGKSLAALGRLDAAEAAIRRTVEMSEGSPISRAALARVLALQGRASDARAIIRELESEGEGGYVPSYEIAQAHLALGDEATAIRRLERAIAERSHSVALLGVDPQLEGLRDAPAFRDLLRRVDLLDVAEGRRR